MKQFAGILFLLFSFTLLSCEKVIDINVRESETRYVIEGVITNEPGDAKVLLSLTKPFNQDNSFTPVSNAIVKIKDNGAEILFVETAPGRYENNTLVGIPGHLYELEVAINSEIFTARCVMPQLVLIDTLYIAPGPFGQFKFANVGYTDPAGVDNGHRFVQCVNGRKDPEIFWENDELNDGDRVIVELDTGVDKQDDPRNINSGDTVTIEMLTLDEQIYKFWYSLRTGGGNGDGNTAAPANPLSNIRGGALGYFSAHGIDRESVIAP